MNKHEVANTIDSAEFLLEKQKRLLIELIDDISDENAESTPGDIATEAIHEFLLRALDIHEVDVSVSETKIIEEIARDINAEADK